MNSIGIIRKVDELGRVVIPIEIREKFQIEEKTQVEIFVEGNRIILKKFEDSCSLCNNREDLVEFNNKLICTNCLDKIKSM